MASSDSFDYLWFILQDRSIQKDWASPLRRYFNKGCRFSGITTNYIIGNYIKHLTNYHLYRKSIPCIDSHIIFAFIHSQNVIKHQNIISQGHNFIFKRVECYSQDTTDETLMYIMVQPRESTLPMILKHQHHELPISNDILSLFKIGIVRLLLQFWKLNSEVLFDETFILRSLFRTFQYHTIMNLIYVKDIDFPCLLLPEPFAISLEMIDHYHILRLKKSHFDFPNLNYRPIFIRKDKFHEKEIVGAGGSGKCVIFESKGRIFPDEALSKQKFVGKEIEIKKSHEQNTESECFTEESSVISSCTRSKLLMEEATILFLFSLRNANIVKPHTLRINTEEFDIILYDIKNNELEIIATMEYVDGTNLSKASIDKIGESDKLFIAVKLAEAVFTIHESDHAHNDLHKDNIILERDTNSPIIIDAGSCEVLDSFNRKKDIKLYTNALHHLYGINKSSNLDHMPHFLQKLFKGTFDRKFETMGEILEEFCKVGILWERTFLDFKKYIAKIPLIYNSLDYDISDEPLSPEVRERDMIKSDELYHYRKEFEIGQQQYSNRQMASIKTLLQNESCAVS